MRMFLHEEEGHSETGAAVAVLVVVVVLLFVMLYGGGFFNRPSEPGIDINIRPGS